MVYFVIKSNAVLFALQENCFEIQLQGICSFSIKNCQEAPNCCFKVTLICFHCNCSECNERDCLGMVLGSMLLQCENLVNFRNNMIKKSAKNLFQATM